MMASGRGQGAGSALLAAVQREKPLNDVRNLLDKMKTEGLNIDSIRDSDGSPLLHAAIGSMFDIPEVVFLLLEFGASPALTDTRGWTALHKAASVDSVEILAAMMTGVDINMQDDSGDTLLHVATRSRSIETAEWLVFAGADTNIANKSKQQCSHVVPKNCFQLKEVLRCNRSQLPRPYFLSSGRVHAVSSPDDQFSLALDETVTCTATRVSIMVRQFEDSNSIPVPCRNGEKLWGHPLEFRGTLETQVLVVFGLHDCVDSFHQLVFRQKSEGEEATETPADIVDEETQARDEAPESTGRPRRIASARARIKLKLKGALGLVHRPKTDELKVGPRGGHVQSSVDPRVEATVTVMGKALTEEKILHLQVEKAPPLEVVTESPPEDPAQEGAAPSAQGDCTKPALEVKQSALAAMSPVFTTICAPSNADRDVQRMEARVTLPLTDQFIEEREAFIFTRSTSVEDQALNSDDELDQETRRWSARPEGVSIPPNTLDISIPASINQTTTLVQSRPGASRAEVKKAVAKQHLKSKQKPVTFIVFHRCMQDDNIGLPPYYHDVIFSVRAVSSNHHAGGADDSHFSKGYKKVKVSDVIYVPDKAYFRITADKSVVMSKASSADILFQYGIHTSPSDSSCHFHVRADPHSPVTAVDFEIEKSKMRRRKHKTGKKWKSFLRVSVSLQDGAPQPEPQKPQQPPKSQPPTKPQPEAANPFTDQLLMALADKVPRDKPYILGVHLGLSSTTVDDILMRDNSHPSNVKMFQILRAARVKLAGPRQFASRLFKEFESLELNETAEWLKNEIKDFPLDWSHFDPIPQIQASRR